MHSLHQGSRPGPPGKQLAKPGTDNDAGQKPEITRQVDVLEWSSSAVGMSPVGP